MHRRLLIEKYELNIFFYHSYMTQDPYMPQKPMSPNLSKALQNQNIKTASYTLPDGTIIDPRQQVTHDLLVFLS